MGLRANAAIAVLGLLPLVACESNPPIGPPEGDGVEIGGASSVQLECERYCNASFSAGCPPAFEGCAKSCQTLFRGTCEQKLADYLACIPSRLTPTCLVVQDEICGAAARELEQCQFCGNGYASVVGERGCEGDFACGLATRCDDDGFCTCYQAGALVGACAAVVAGIDGCLVGTSCCTAFL